MTRIYIIRHGESLGNAAGVFLGHTDWDLSERGYRQAALTAEKLSTVHFDRIYSSDLLRAMNTAAPHAEMRRLQVIPDSELREVNVGAWEGQKGLGETDGETLMSGGWRKIFGTFTFPEGESVFDAGNRVYREIERLAAENDGSQILLAMHAAVITAFWCLIMGLPREEWASLPFPSNASYSIVEYNEGKFLPLEYSIDSHLP